MNSKRLAVVKTIHTLIYVVMVAAIGYVFYAGITKTFGIWLIVALGLLTVEGIVFFGFGMTCPLTILSTRYGDPSASLGGTFFPPQCTRYTFKIFGALLFLGLLILLIDVLT